MHPLRVFFVGFLHTWYSYFAFGNVFLIKKRGKNKKKRSKRKKRDPSKKT